MEDSPFPTTLHYWVVCRIPITTYGTFIFASTLRGSRWIETLNVVTHFIGYWQVEMIALIWCKQLATNAYLPPLHPLLMEWMNEWRRERWSHLMISYHSHPAMANSASLYNSPLPPVVVPRISRMVADFNGADFNGVHRWPLHSVFSFIFWALQMFGTPHFCR